jgi:hypothetical protein
MRSTESFEAHLGSGESLVWSGTGSDKLLVRSDYVFVLSGALLGVVALAAFIASLLAVFAGDGAAAFVGLVASMVAGVIALILMFGRLIRRQRRTQNSQYAITNERVIKLLAHGQPSEIVVELADKPRTSFTNHFERRGTITVGSIKIENIDDAAVVYELLSAELAKVSRG